jgi:hypothetical protein
MYVGYNTKIENYTHIWNVSYSQKLDTNFQENLKYK